MTVHRFFVAPGEAPPTDRFPLPASIAHQVRRVLRLRDGAPLVLLTGDGTQIRCRLDRDACVVEARALAGGEPAHRLTIVQALLKGDGLDEVVDRGTEIGVAAFELVVTDRTIARELSERRLSRLRSIAAEAAARAERARVPVIREPVSLEAALDPSTFLLYERASSGSLLQHGATPTRLAIGPEGGFTDTEVGRALAAGATVVSLGPRILRARAAGVVGAALVLGASGDLG